MYFASLSGICMTDDISSEICAKESRSFKSFLFFFSGAKILVSARQPQEPSELQPQRESRAS